MVISSSLGVSLYSWCVPSRELSSPRIALQKFAASNAAPTSVSHSHSIAIPNCIAVIAQGIFTITITISISIAITITIFFARPLYAVGQQLGQQSSFVSPEFAIIVDWFIEFLLEANSSHTCAKYLKTSQTYSMRSLFTPQ